VGTSVLGLVAFIAIELRTAAPLIDLSLLRNGALSAPLVNMAVVSSIVMATLVVGPFYLTGVLHLNAVQTGLVMSVGPAIAAIAGLPAGKLVDHFGPNPVMAVGIAGAIVGSALMIGTPGIFGVTGYVLSLAIITAGYALFQAANNTAVMSLAANNQRGVISALLGLARNLGLVSGASAMGSIFALGSRGVPILGLGMGGDAGLKLTFAVATGLAASALAIAIMGFRSAKPPH
jgi:MFS family permease